LAAVGFVAEFNWVLEARSHFMKKIYIGIGVAVLVVGGLVVAARAHSRYMGMGHHGGHMFERGLAIMAWKLDLTDAQQQQIRAMAKAGWPELQPSLQKLADGQKQMLAATQGGTFDEAQVTAIANQQSQTIADLLVAKERFVSQVYANVLTADQRTKADAMREKWNQRFEQYVQEHAAELQGVGK
jgi:Spy/CpxP family protein refolding chaperone